jgi:hypothetical protein
MTIDSLLTIVAGLGFRIFMESISRHDFRLTSALVGLWEGFVVHHYSWDKPSYWDPFIACAFRLFVDFLITRSHLRMILVILWTGIGLAVSEVVAASLTIDNPEPRIVRSSRAAVRPRRRTAQSRVRFDGIEPLSSTDLSHVMTPHAIQSDPAPSVGRTILRNSPQVTTQQQRKQQQHLPPQLEVDPYPKFDDMPTRSRALYSRPPLAIQTSILPTVMLDPDTRSMSSNQPSNAIPTHQIVPLYDVQATPPEDREIAENFPVLPELHPPPTPQSGDVLHAPLELNPAAAPSSDSDLEHLVDMNGSGDTTPTIRSTRLTESSPSLSGADDHLHDEPQAAISDNLDHTPTVPVLQLPLELPSSLPTVDHDTALDVKITRFERPLPPLPIDDLPNGIPTAFIAPELDTPSFTPANHSPLPSIPDQQPDHGTAHTSLPTGGAFSYPRVADNPPPDTAPVDSGSGTHTPDDVSIGGLESTTTEPESVITVGTRAHVMARADTFREQAVAHERESHRLNEAMRISFREGRIIEGHLLEGECQDAEKLSTQLHAKAARRYFYGMPQFCASRPLTH